jgi:hypothetical protein
MYAEVMSSRPAIAPPTRIGNKRLVFVALEEIGTVAILTSGKRLSD